MINIGLDKKGIVGKYPNSKRHGDPIGSGQRTPHAVSHLMNQSIEKAKGKHGES
jgi:hypothetical protein